MCHGDQSTRGPLSLKVLSAVAFSGAVTMSPRVVTWLLPLARFLTIPCASELNEFTFELLHTVCAFMTFYHNCHMMTGIRVLGSMLPASHPSSSESRSMSWAHRILCQMVGTHLVYLSTMVRSSLRTTSLPIICVGEFRSPPRIQVGLPKTPSSRYQNLPSHTAKACLQDVTTELANRGSSAQLHRHGGEPSRRQPSPDRMCSTLGQCEESSRSAGSQRGSS